MIAGDPLSVRKVAVARREGVNGISRLESRGSAPPDDMPFTFRPPARLCGRRPFRLCRSPRVTFLSVDLALRAHGELASSGSDHVNALCRFEKWAQSKVNSALDLQFFPLETIL